MNKLSIRIETTPAIKTTLPWVTAVRRGRESAETQCFALFGCPESELAQLPAATQEHLSEIIELALKLLGAFEYVPRDPALLDDFFEKKLINFEGRIRDSFQEEFPLHAAIGVVADTRVLFATIGDMLALQISPAGITNVATGSSGRTFHFDTFHSGLLTQRSNLLFIPKKMGTFFKSDELKQLTFTGTTGPKINYLEHLWANRGTGSGTLKAVLLETRLKAPPGANTTEVSIARLLDTEAKTEELLSPPLLRPLINQAKRSSQKLFETLERAKTFVARLKDKESAPIAKKPTPPSGTPTLPPLLHYSSRFARTFQTRLSTFKKNVSTPHISFKNLKPLPTLHPEGLITRFNALPRGSKILFFLSALAFFVFAQSVLLGMGKTRTQQFKNELQNEVDALRTLLNEANAAAIYGDEEGAQAKIEAATARINTLPTFQKELMRKFDIRPLRRFDLSLPQTTIAELTASIEPVKAVLRHLITVDALLSVSEPNASALGLGQDSPLRAPYGKRLYTLRTDKNQILKHEPKESGFDEGTPWLKDGASVKNGVAIAVDGSIYVLESTGNVLEFRKGSLASFTLKSIDPALSSPVKIWTDENSNYLYILEPATKRLAVFSKRDGLLKTQYTSPTLQELKDFKIDENAKVAYLLDGTDVFSIPLSHLTK